MSKLSERIRALECPHKPELEQEFEEMEYCEAFENGFNTAISAAAQLAAEAPSWMERPSGPGLWVCMPDASLRSPLNGIVTLELDGEDLARGAPFHTSVVFGPLPKAPAMKGEGDE